MKILAISVNYNQIQIAMPNINDENMKQRKK